MSRPRIEQSLANGLGYSLLVLAIGVVPLLSTVALAASQAAEPPGRREEALPIAHHVTELAPELARLHRLVARRPLRTGLI